jgi:vibriolysin
MASMAACQGWDGESTGVDATAPGTASGVVTVPHLLVVDTDKANVPTFANGDFGRIRVSKDQKTEKQEELALRPILTALAPTFRVNPEELTFQKAVTDNIGDRHFVYGQRKNGLEVIGGALVLHTRNDAVYAVHGSARADLAAPRTPQISAKDAVTLAKESSPLLDQLKADANPLLAYWREGNTLELVYRVNVTGVLRDGTPVDDDVIVNAVSGSIVERLPNILTFKNREIHDLNHTTSLPGPISRTEGGPAVSDAVVNTNYNLLGLTYDCYKNLFNRDSYDNAGATLVSSVHYGTNHNNAGWAIKSKQMIYGDGDGVSWGNFADALDVTAHELTHGVTASSSNLYPYAQPGALNESMSDIMGSVCEWYRNGQVVNANTWRCAEDIWTPGVAGDALRYMNDPKKDGRSYDYFDGSFSEANDIHLNSGIPNLAFYLLSQGGTHPRGRSGTRVTGIGIAKAAQIFYRANTVTLLGNNYAKFTDAKTATEQAAAQLGYSATDIASVTAAWHAVGVGANAIDDSEFFIRQTYRDVLKREADAGGLAFYLNSLQSCNGNTACLASNRVAIARGMLESSENRQQDPELNPASSGYNSAFITHCYTNFLRREPDSAGFNWWLSVLNSGGDYNGVVSGFITSAEYRQRFGRE